MKLREMGHIGRAALYSAGELIDEYESAVFDTLMISGAELVQWQQAEDMARFVITAGDVGGEALYRWMAGKNLHPLPGDGYAQVSEPIRVFFECFVATTKALASVLMPKSNSAPLLRVPTQSPPLSETIFEPHDAPGARTYANVRDEVPRVWNPGVPEGLPAGTRQVGTIGSIPVFENAGMPEGQVLLAQVPTQEQFMRMSPEERRPWAHLFGLPDIHNDPAYLRPTSRAPELSGETRAVRPAIIPDDLEPGVTVKVTEPRQSAVGNRQSDEGPTAEPDAAPAAIEPPISEAPQRGAAAVASGAPTENLRAGEADAPAAEPIADDRSPTAARRKR
jgi:hypothetical protein